MKFSDVFESKERTDSYRFTYHPDNPASWLKLQQLKKEVSDHNATITRAVKDGHLTPNTRKYGQRTTFFGDWHDKEGNVHVKKKVSKFGRLGKDNPAAFDYSRKNPDRRRSKRVQNDDAQRFDVYVHDSRRYKYSDE